jgi:hypothetical protein
MTKKSPRNSNIINLAFHPIMDFFIPAYRFLPPDLPVKSHLFGDFISLVLICGKNIINEAK